VSTGLEKHCRLDACQMSFCELYGKPKDRL
jgi:hypothetical protein